jgi:hypothetical protein
MFTRFGNNPDKVYQEIVDLYRDAKREIVACETEVDDLVFSQCRSLKNLSTQERQALKAWSARETEARAQQEANAEESFPCPIDLVDRVLVRYVLSQSLVADGTADSSRLSAAVLDWIEHGCGQPLQICIPERLQFISRRFMRNKLPPNWQRAVSNLIEQAKAVRDSC